MMITGDYHHTAIAVARDVGMISLDTPTVIVDIASHGRPGLSDQGQHVQQWHDSQEPAGNHPPGLGTDAPGQGLHLGSPEQSPEHQLEAQLSMAQNMLEASCSRTLFQEGDDSLSVEEQQAGSSADQRTVIFAGVIGGASPAGLSQHSSDVASTSAAAAGESHQSPAASAIFPGMKKKKKSYKRVQLPPLATSPTSHDPTSPAQSSRCSSPRSHSVYRAQPLPSDDTSSPLPIIVPPDADHACLLTSPCDGVLSSQMLPAHMSHGQQNSIITPVHDHPPALSARLTPSAHHGQASPWPFLTLLQQQSHPPTDLPLSSLKPPRPALEGLRFIQARGGQDHDPGLVLKALSEGHLQCAVTGDAFNHMLQLEDLSLLESVMRSAVVFARMKPQQKGQVMDLLGVTGIRQLRQERPRHIQVTFCHICVDKVGHGLDVFEGVKVTP